MNDSKDNQTPVLYLPHGGGPLPLMGDKGHQEMVSFLNQLATTITQPESILVISAHWEEEVPTITSGAYPELIYDYYGFPKETYEIQYKAPGQPALANTLSKLLAANHIPFQLDNYRGFDHGLFVPLKMLFPSAHIPCIQLSLVKGLNPSTHIRLGQAIKAIRQENVLIIGSGMSFHNLGALMNTSSKLDEQNAAFQKWLIDGCTNPQLDPLEREQRLINWEQAPYARYCHPREEHLLPLHVCFGAGGHQAKVVFDGLVLNKQTIALQWQ